MTMPFTDFLQTGAREHSQLFTGSGVSANTFAHWHKPDNVGLVWITCVGAGGNGGQGASQSAAGAGGGGGGGGGACTKLLVPACMIPDTLFIQPGALYSPSATSTNTGSAGSAGGSGAISYVLIRPDASYTPANVLCASGSVAAAGGSGGPVSSGTASGGAGETVFTSAIGNLFNLGLIQSGISSAIAGQAGASGGSASGSVGGSITALSSTTNIHTTGGAGGGGASAYTSYAGGNVTGAGFLTTLSGSAGTSTQAAGLTYTGSNGYDFRTGSLYPFLSTSGSGTGSNAVMTSSYCGFYEFQASGLGSGGTGGPASVIDNLNGDSSTSGQGGDGYVLIVCK